MRSVPGCAGGTRDDLMESDSALAATDGVGLASRTGSIATHSVTAKEKGRLAAPLRDGLNPRMTRLPMTA